MSAVRTVLVIALTAFSALSIAGDFGKQMERHTIDHDGIEREYFVYLPSSASSGQKLPVIVGIHGYTSTATGFAASNNLNVHAEENGYILVYPQGSHFEVKTSTGDGDGNRITSWNDLAANLGPKNAGPHCVDDAYQYPCPEECGECNRCAWTGCYDDVGFLERVLDDIESWPNSDPSRIYVLGVSNGGMMTWRVGCDLSDRFAAIAPIIGQLAPGYACGPNSDTPTMHLFGGKDDVVRADGEPGGDGFIYETPEHTAAVWAESMNCQSGPSPWTSQYATSAGLVCSAYSDCNTESHEVVSCVDPEGRHEWPSQGYDEIPGTCVTEEQYDSMPGQGHCPKPESDPHRDGIDLVWEFFNRFPG